MMSRKRIGNTYDNPLAGYGYDLLSRLVFAPLGGLTALREQALTAIDIRARMRVLELGCGTGAMTRRLLRRGVDVTSVDQSEPMLRLARRRAPGATFECSEITKYEPQGHYDRVLFSFVLHELDPPARAKALAIGREALSNDGSVAIVDHALPKTGLVPRAVSAFVHKFEPKTVVDWLRGGFDTELVAAGLVPHTRQDLARGTAIVIACQAP